MKTKKRISVILLALVLILTLCFAAAACGDDDDTFDPPGRENLEEEIVENDLDTGAKKSFKVVVPDGAPLASITQMRHDVTRLNGNNLTYSVDPENLLLSDMTNGMADFIIAPTNVGANVHNSTGNYKLAASTSWGMLYFVTTDKSLVKYSKGNAQTFLAQFADKTIETIGEMAIPGQSLKYLLNNKGVSATLHGVDNPALITAMINNNESVIGVIAEPVLTTVKNDPNCKVLGSVSDIYEEVTGKGFPMASLFIKKSVIESYETTVKLFLGKLNDSIDFMNNNPAKIAEWAEKAGSSAIKEATFPSAMPNMNIRYKIAADAKEDVKTLLTNVGAASVPDTLFM